MVVSALIVTTDGKEYCKYTSDKKTISVTAKVSSGTLTAGDQFVFSIERKSAQNWTGSYSAVMKKTVTATSSDVTSGSLSSQFVIGIDDIDADHICRAISGEYSAQVTLISDTTKYWNSSSFSIVLITAKEMRTEWCFGVPLKAAEMMSVRFQPKIITGLTIEEISASVIPGIKKLTLTYSATPSPAWTLAWDEGTPTAFTAAAGTQQVLLVDETNINYIIAEANTSILPTSNTTESILVSESIFTDEMIMKRIRSACDATESFFGFPIEPYVYTSIPNLPSTVYGDQTNIQSYWDRLGRPADYYVPVDYSNWPTFRLPYQWCLALHDLYGFHSVNKILTVNKQWFTTTVDRITSVATLVPSLRSFAQWQVFTHPMLAPFFLRTNLPGFWQYTATFGLPDLTDSDRAPVRELVARTAAASILTDAGRAYQGGLGGESTSRDGLSNSRSYNPGGPYAATIQAHQQWVQTEGARLKQRLGGMLIQMLGA